LIAAGQGSHAALMDGIYRHQRHVYDLTRYGYLLGRNQLIADLDPPPGGPVLEVGCGTGRNLVTAAARYPNAHFYGFDISAEMLKTARQSIASASAGERIWVAEGSALSFAPEPAFGRARFDRIFFSYTLSMIPGWQAALAHALTMLSPGGKLFVVDFGQCEALPRWCKRGLFSWLDLFHVTPRADLEPFMRALASSHGARLEWQPLYSGYAWRASLILP
jgi:S-adenosylmethionine-diacylgycerolhomoserine-N-methlytransferase